MAWQRPWPRAQARRAHDHDRRGARGMVAAATTVTVTGTAARRTVVAPGRGPAQPSTATRNRLGIKPADCAPGPGSAAPAAPTRTDSEAEVPAGRRT